MTLLELRDRMAREVHVHEPMPDLVGVTVRTGRARVRRRRLVAGGLLSVALVGAGLLAAGLVGNNPVARDVAAARQPTHLVGDEEYREAIRSTLADLLPGRYGDVTVRPNAAPDGSDVFVSTGPVQTQLSFRVRGMPDDPAIVNLTSCEIRGPNFSECVDTRFDGWLAESATVRDRPEAYLTLNDWGLEAWLTHTAGDHASLLTMDEQQALLREPAFLALVRLGVDHATDRPSPGRYCNAQKVCGPMPKPRWLH